MTKKTILSAVALCFIFTASALAAPTTIEVVSETDDSVTYRIKDADGIRQVIFTYSPVHNDLSKTYTDCPTEITITVSKESTFIGEELTELGDVASLGQVSIEDCMSSQPNSNHNELRIFNVTEEGSIQFGNDSAVLQVMPPTPPTVTPTGQFVFDWWYLLLIIWLLLTFYLLWWRIFGPFRSR